MKRFFISFLGAMAALWITAIIATLGLVVLIAAVSSANSDSNRQQVEKESILCLDLNDPIVERSGERPSMQDMLMGNIDDCVSLEKITTSIRAAATDDRIKGLYIKTGLGDMGLAQANAIIKAIEEFKQSGKWVLAYGDQSMQTSYYVAAAADSIFINPIGMIDIHGLSSEVMYYKNFLDKIGVSVDIVRVGTYKSAVEPFMLDHMSPASREQIEAYIGSLWSDMSASIAKNRRVTVQKVNAWADSIAFFQTGEFYKQQKLVDGLLYEHQMTQRLRDLTGRDDDEEPQLVSINEYYASKSVKPFSGSGKHIAVLYAVGEISENGTTGIASDDLVPEIEALADDEDVVGLILRVNSPGGSAFASEQIWEALEEYKAKTGNPFYVSMSDLAASGGYYISCGADRIYAEPLTITGSIGIFGMVPNVSELLSDKLGVNVDVVATNPQGQLPMILTPMSPRQRGAMQAYVNHGYDLFTKRCAEGRHMSQDSIKAIAEGRVWDGRTALSIGLVDQLGGLDIAIADMASKVGLDTDKVVAYPEMKFDWMYEMMKLSNNIEERLVASHLGAAYPFYKKVKELENTSVLQTRMEHSVPR